MGEMSPKTKAFHIASGSERRACAVAFSVGAVEGARLGNGFGAAARVVKHLYEAEGEVVGGIEAAGGWGLRAVGGGDEGGGADMSLELEDDGMM